MHKQSYCDGCRRFCELGSDIDIITWIRRPRIGTTIVYDYIDANNKKHTAPIHTDYATVVHMAMEISKYCHHHRNRQK